jgi:hypothetical protein
MKISIPQEPGELPLVGDIAGNAFRKRFLRLASAVMEFVMGPFPATESHKLPHGERS